MQEDLPQLASQNCCTVTLIIWYDSLYSLVQRIDSFNTVFIKGHTPTTLSDMHFDQSGNFPCHIIQSQE